MVVKLKDFVIRMSSILLGISRSLSSLGHGSRYVEAESCEGVLRKKTRDVIAGAVLGILKGQSVTANWTDYRFILKPGATAIQPAALMYFEDGEEVPHSTMLLDYSSTVEEQGRSKSHDFLKIEVTGKNPQGEALTWNLKVTEADGAKWIKALHSVCKARWEENTSACSACNAAFGLTRPWHHCRRCGRCVCEPCSPASRMVPAADLFIPVRVCNKCSKALGVGDGVLA